MIIIGPYLFITRTRHESIRAGIAQILPDVTYSMT